MIEVTLRFKTDDPAVADALVRAWLHDGPVTIVTEGREDAVTPTYVKERDR